MNTCRCLPEDQVHETGLEAVIDEIADFVKPTGGNVRGKYTLKPHLYDEYDIFFYHYTREDLSRSEERQRNRRKAAGLIYFNKNSNFSNSNIPSRLPLVPETNLVLTYATEVDRILRATPNKRS